MHGGINRLLCEIIYYVMGWFSTPLVILDIYGIQCSYMITGIDANLQPLTKLNMSFVGR